MGVATSSFNSTVPSGTSSIRQGDDDIRSTKSIVQAVINDEHYFDNASASSASGGIHKQGSARVFVNTRANIAAPNSADSNGRLAFATDTGALLFMHTSSLSTIAGGSQPMGATAYSVAPQAIASGVESVLTYSTEEYDAGGFYTASEGTFTVPAGQGGRYMLSAYLEMPSDATGTQHRLKIRRDGSVVLAAFNSLRTQLDNTHINLFAIDTASAGTEYDVTYQHSAGVDQAVATARFSITKVV